MSRKSKYLKPSEVKSGVTGFYPYLDMYRSNWGWRVKHYLFLGRPFKVTPDHELYGNLHSGIWVETRDDYQQIYTEFGRVMLHNGHYFFTSRRAAERMAAGLNRELHGKVPPRDPRKKRHDTSQES